MAVVKKIIHVLAVFTVVLLLIYVILCLPIIFGYKPLVVLSGSMEPTLKTGSIIYYSKIEEKKLKIGDIVVFKVNNSLISHRIVNIENGLYETKGDANKVKDAKKISYQHIVGRNSDITIPYIGYYVKYVNEHRYLIIIAVIVLVSEYLMSNVKAFDIDKNREEM